MRTPHPKYSKFRFDAGSLALNFVAVVRHRGSQPRDLFFSANALSNWLAAAGCAGGSVAATEQDLEHAILLREAIYRALSALALRNIPDPADLDLINAAAAEPLSVPQIELPSCGLRWKSKNPVQACLAEVARDAVMVIATIDRERLKMCDSSSCRMLFADNSPANRRRWCSMSICGNRAKIKVFRERKKQPPNLKTG